MKKEAKQYLYLEYLRIISIIFVIFNHTGLEGFMLYSLKSPHSILFWIELLLSVFCKFAVPVFFMISGFLLFKKDYTKEQIINKIKTMVIVLVVFSFIYYVTTIIIDKASFNLLDFIRNLLTCNISVHFWYLYMYILLLISYPILSIIIKRIDKDIIKYLIGLTILFKGIIPVIYFLIYKEQFAVNMLMTPFWCIDTIILYPCIGYYLGTQFKLKNKKQLQNLWIINIISLLISCLMTYYLYRLNGGLEDSMSSQIFYNSFVIINAITIFITFKYIFEVITLDNKIKFISRLGKYVFGIYLIHPLIKLLTSYNHLHDFVINHFSSSIILLIVICTYMFIYSFIITFVLSKIPHIKRIVGFK